MLGRKQRRCDICRNKKNQRDSLYLAYNYNQSSFICDLQIVFENMQLCMVETKQKLLNI